MPRTRLTPSNLVTAVRLLAAPALAVAGWFGRDVLFLLLFLGVAGSDWLDGLLARARDEVTAFGARMDTVADAVMYTSLVAGLVWLKGPDFVAAWPWMAVAVVSWILSWAASIVRFGRPPGYHTPVARGTGVLVFATVLAFLLTDRIWLVQAATVAVTAANVEAFVLTLRKRA